MTVPQIPVVREDGFESSSSYAGSTLTLHFSGSAELNVTDVLGPLLVRAHEEALRLAVTQVDVDFAQLQFMNSSCFKRFVTWLNLIQEGAGGYRVRFVSNPRFRWQRASLAALSCFAPDLITVDPSGAPLS